MIKKNDISEDVKRLEENLGNLGYSNHCVHTGPLIRGEKEYRDEDIKIRQKILKNMIAFIRHVEISFHMVYIEKRKAEDEIMATSMLSKQISHFWIMLNSKRLYLQITDYFKRPIRAVPCVKPHLSMESTAPVSDQYLPERLLVVCPILEPLSSRIY